MRCKGSAYILGILMMSLSLMIPNPAATQAPEPECTLIDFEEVEGAALVGNFYASKGVHFETFDAGNGIAWDVLRVGQAAQRPPSGNQFAHLSYGGQPPCGLQAAAAPGASIFFDFPVQSVRFKYAGCNEASVEAFNGNDVSLGKAMGGKTGNGPPYSNWSPLGIEVPDGSIRRVMVRGVAVIDDLEFCKPPPRPCPPFTIQTNFNAFPISGGRFIWFNSAFNVSGLGSAPTTIRFVQSTIQFKANGTQYKLKVPSAIITFSPTATLATTTFDTTTQTWRTIVASSTGGNVFLSGLTFPVHGGIPPQLPLVAWTGSFTTDTPGVTLQWKWAAAVYTLFSTQLDELGVKPVDDSTASQYQNSHPAGTPETFSGYVTGGALGGGFFDYTGSYRASRPIAPCVVQ